MRAPHFDCFRCLVELFVGEWIHSFVDWPSHHRYRIFLDVSLRLLVILCDVEPVILLFIETKRTHSVMNRVQIKNIRLNTKVVTVIIFIASMCISIMIMIVIVITNDVAVTYLPRNGGIR